METDSGSVFTRSQKAQKGWDSGRDMTADKTNLLVTDRCPFSKHGPCQPPRYPPQKHKPSKITLSRIAAIERRGASLSFSKIADLKNETIPHPPAPEFSLI